MFDNSLHASYPSPHSDICPSLDSDPGNELIIRMNESSPSIDQRAANVGSSSVTDTNTALVHAVPTTNPNSPIPVTAPGDTVSAAPAPTTVPNTTTPAPASTRAVAPAASVPSYLAHTAVSLARQRPARPIVRPVSHITSLVLIKLIIKGAHNRHSKNEPGFKKRFGTFLNSNGESSTRLHTQAVLLIDRESRNSKGRLPFRCRYRYRCSLYRCSGRYRCPVYRCPCNRCTPHRHYSRSRACYDLSGPRSICFIRNRNDSSSCSNSNFCYSSCCSSYRYPRHRNTLSRYYIRCRRACFDLLGSRSICFYRYRTTSFECSCSCSCSRS